MLILDTNAILRYMLSDNLDMAIKVNEIITNNRVMVRYEVIAEVVYVLEGVYSLSRSKVKDSINTFLSVPNIETESKSVLLLALEAYADKDIDFVDCLLYAFKALQGYDVFTFDKKLNKLLNTIVQD